MKMTHHRLTLEGVSRVGARLSNWNDRRHGPHLGRKPRPRMWRSIDRVAAWLYVLPER